MSPAQTRANVLERRSPDRHVAVCQSEPIGRSALPASFSKSPSSPGTARWRRAFDSRYRTAADGRQEAQGVGDGAADTANAAAIHQGQLVDGEHHGFRLRGFGRPVGAEHAVVGVVVDLRAEDVADEEGKAEGGRKQPHVGRRTVPGQAKRKAHFPLSIAGGRSALRSGTYWYVGSLPIPM